ncbi:MAG: 50S ribosomal protein L4 [Dehalococcoidia bacterium]|nr:50S ribosomal protein L4 [Dehalococcoidia bacterium]MCA9853555.1 50S ribosomal protein L4 [Dehalococcoidia bacterium]
MKLNVVDASGAQARTIDVDDNVFGIEPNAAVVHQAYTTLMSNRRAGGAHTLRRGEVRGSTFKTRRQKGLGRARMGGIRSASRVGGGIAMGPRPRSFRKDLPRQMRRLAIRSALSSHARDGSLTVVDGLAPTEVSTRAMQATLGALNVDRGALIVSGEPDAVLVRSSRNIDKVLAIPAQGLNVVDLVNAHRLIMTEEAVRACERMWGGENLKPRRAPLEVTADAV